MKETGRNILMMIVLGLLCLLLVSCSASGENTSQQQPSGTPSFPNRDMTQTKDPNAPEGAPNIQGGVTKVEADQLTISAMPSGGFPGANGQTPPVNDTQPGISPGGQPNVSPPSGGNRPDLGAMPQGEETDVPLDQAVTISLFSEDGNSQNATEVTEIEDGMMVRIWLNEQDAATYIQVLPERQQG